MVHPVRHRRLLFHVAVLLAVCMVVFTVLHGFLVRDYYSIYFSRGILTTTATVDKVVARAILQPWSGEPLAQVTSTGGTWAWMFRALRPLG